MRNEYERLGTSDYGDIYLKRCGWRIVLKRFSPLDCGYMEDYINENHDIRGEWQEDVWNWNTEQGFDEWREDYSYEYSEYFSYDNETDEYYDEDSSDTLRDYFYPERASKEEIISQVMEYFDNDYSSGNFEMDSDMDWQRIRELIGEYYDKCKQYLKELEESKKPHWNVFNYYK